MNGLSTGRSALFAVLTLLAVSAHADDDCDAPPASWQPRGAVDALAQRNSWQIERLKIDDGCYELRGRDADGFRFKATLNPATLEVVKIKRERERRRDHQHQTPGPGAQSQNPPTPGEDR